MRKITQKAITAFDSNQKFRDGNTSVETSTPTKTELFLHGNCIATKKLATATTPEELWIGLSGWNTPTTRERLNGLAGVRIHTRNGIPYLNGAEMPIREFVKVY